MIIIREITPADNKAIASIVKEVMGGEFNADPKTTVIGDPSLNTMHENYQIPKAAYYVAEIDNKVVGGCGIKQLDGSKENICELQRMFLLQEARGKNIGKELLEKCISKAKEFGYKLMYLESLSNMKDAKKLYDKFGFKEIDTPMGNTGHGGCNVWMTLEL